MPLQSDVIQAPTVARGTRWPRWVAGMGACAVIASGERLLGIDAEQILSVNAGNFLIQPQLDASAQFTGNLFYGVDNPRDAGIYTIQREINGVVESVDVLAAGQSEVTSDLLWYVSPGLEIQYGKNPENSLSLGYFHDFILYTDHSDFNSGQDRIQFDARLQKGRFTLIGSDSVAWLDTILGGSTAVNQRVPVRRLAWNDNYRLTYDSSMKTDVYTVFTHDLINYLQSINLYDQGTIRGTVGATYKPTERIGLFVEGGLGHTDITANLPPPPGPGTMVPGEDSWVYGGFVGVRGTFTPRINGSVKVGYETRDFTGTDTEGDGGGVAVGMALSYTPTERLLVNLAYDRRVGVSSLFAGQSFQNGVLSLGAVQQIGIQGKWSVQGRFAATFGTYSSLDTPGFGLVPGQGLVEFPVDQGSDNQNYNVSVGVSYQPRPWLTSSLTYSFEKFNSEFDDPYAALTSALNDFVVNRVILQVSLGY